MPDNTMLCYIPSKGRVKSQITLKNLQGWSYPNNTILVVPDDEYDAYRAECSGLCTVWATPPGLKGIAATRQFVLDNSRTRYSLFLDDDMEFAVRTGEGTKLRKAGPLDITRMMALLNEWLMHGFVHVGISARGGNNHTEKSYIEVGRMNNAYAYDVDIVNKLGIKFDRLEVMEDFDVTLSLLEQGHPNRITYEYTWNQKQSGAPGGCSTYRTGKLQADCARKLAALHPGVVSVVQKESKAEWEGIGKTRTDVIISWKQAYRPKREKNSGIMRFI